MSHPNPEGLAIEDVFRRARKVPVNGEVYTVGELFVRKYHEHPDYSTQAFHISREVGMNLAVVAPFNQVREEVERFELQLRNKRVSKPISKLVMSVR